MKTVKSLKELQEFAVQRNDSDMLSVIYQAKVSVESQAAKRVKCMQKTLLQCNVCVCSIIIV
jgi:hypothetical protein